MTDYFPNSAELDKFAEILKRQGYINNFEFQLRGIDGELYWTLSSASIINYRNETCVITSFVDITERKHRENIMQARLRLLEFTNSHPMSEFLTATLDEIEALTGSTIGFYHFLEPDQETLLVQNWSTNTLRSMCSAEGRGSHYKIAQAGVWVDCVHERRPVIHNDYASLPHRKGMPEGHPPVVREAVVPVVRGNLIRAIIGVGNKSTDYNESDIEVISLLGGLLWDITERKRAEEMLKESEEKYRTLVDNMQDAVYRCDLNGDLIFTTPSAARLLGYPSAESMIGMNLARDLFYCPEDREKLLNILNEQGEVTKYEVTLKHRENSRPIIISTNTQFYRDREGNIIGNEGIYSDITERKHAEEALRESEKRLSEIINFLPDATFAIDNERKIIA